LGTHFVILGYFRLLYFAKFFANVDFYSFKKGHQDYFILISASKAFKKSVFFLTFFAF